MSGSAEAEDKEGIGFSGRLIEIIVVMLLGVTTLGTAWCSYEAYQWNGQQADLTRDAAKEQLESGRLFSLATQTFSYDVNLIADYALAYRAGDEQALAFYRESLMRPGFLPFLDIWVAEVQAGRPPGNLLDDEAYTSEILGPYRASIARAATLDNESSLAGETSDRYLVTTILLAMGLFFGGVTASFRWPVVKLMTLALGVLAVGLAAVRLVDLPVIW